jgi:hypothetical protein
MKRYVNLLLLVALLLTNGAGEVYPQPTTAGTGLSIKRLQLYFDNRRAETTVKKNTPALKAFADIRYAGTGLLEGLWEVDGRLLSHVKKHLVFGGSIIFVAPETPPIPTFEAGIHHLRFVLTRPDEDIPIPVAIYFVTEEKFRPKALPMDLISPGDGSTVDFATVTFTWEEKDGSVLYLIEFLEEGWGSPIFSTFKKNGEYTMPSPILKSIFSPGKEYLWRVKVFDTEKNVTGESRLSRFRFKEKAAGEGKQ